MKDSCDKIRRMLFEHQDLGYKSFCSSLMPTVSPDRVIGVRTPQLRAMAKDLRGTQEAMDFLSDLPHEYYEEDNLHALLIEGQKDYGAVIASLCEFLPYIDNWASCDMISPKIFKRHTLELYSEIEKWMSSEHTYTVRFGIGMLMKFYLDADFKPEYAEAVSRVRSDEYYIKMMVAWYFATALAKQHSAVIHYLEDKVLDAWTHNKTIRKAIESFRISEETKKHLRLLIIKN